MCCVVSQITQVKFSQYLQSVAIRLTVSSTEQTYFVGFEIKLQNCAARSGARTSGAATDLFSTNVYDVCCFVHKGNRFQVQNGWSSSCQKKKKNRVILFCRLIAYNCPNPLVSNQLYPPHYIYRHPEKKPCLKTGFKEQTRKRNLETQTKPTIVIDTDQLI